MKSRARSIVAKIGPVKSAYHAVRAGAISFLAARSPRLLAQLRYREAWGRWPDLENPTTFDEKLLWLNLHWHHPLKVECGDRYTMRGYVERQELGHLLPRAYGVYDSVDAIDFRSLPDRFVLKCTHGAKSNVFCHNKTELDVDRARQDLRRWMATDFSKFYGEAHYAKMTPRILCEELLDDGTGLLPPTTRCIASTDVRPTSCAASTASPTARPAWPSRTSTGTRWSSTATSRREGARCSAPRRSPRSCVRAIDCLRPSRSCGWISTTFSGGRCWVN